MRLVRRLLRMSKTLPSPARELPSPDAGLPPGYELRAFREGDEAAWLRLHNRAFADHPDAGGWTLRDPAWHLREPWFEPEGLLLAEGRSGLVGYRWMRREGPLGWIYFLGVAPEARRLGLGSALAGAGLAWVFRAGAGRAALYVDEDNGPALRLYRALGFRVEHEDLCYEVEVRGRSSPGRRSGGLSDGGRSGRAS